VNKHTIDKVAADNLVELANTSNMILDVIWLVLPLGDGEFQGLSDLANSFNLGAKMKDAEFSWHFRKEGHNWWTELN
jgi:hypothetical protein